MREKMENSLEKEATRLALVDELEKIAFSGATKRLLYGGLAGAGVGGLSGAGLGRMTAMGENGKTRRRRTLVGAGVGAGLGGLSGALFASSIGTKMESRALQSARASTRANRFNVNHLIDAKSDRIPSIENLREQVMNNKESILRGELPRRTRAKKKFLLRDARYRVRAHKALKILKGDLQGVDDTLKSVSAKIRSEAFPRRDKHHIPVITTLERAGKLGKLWKPQ